MSLTDNLVVQLCLAVMMLCLAVCLASTHAILGLNLSGDVTSVLQGVVVAGLIVVALVAFLIGDFGSCFVAAVLSLVLYGLLTGDAQMWTVWIVAATAVGCLFARLAGAPSGSTSTARPVAASR